MAVKPDPETDASPAFVLVDGHYVSARWPGDAYTFTRAFTRLLESTTASARTIAADA
jgi:hypothetical protein